jgi:hypothetical protein
MTDFPARGQKAPAYWDTQLKAYIDENDDAPRTISDITDFTEGVQDTVAALLTAGTNITLSYNDTSGTLQISAATGGIDAEAVRDTMAAALIGTSGVSIVVDDAGNTITLTVSSVSMSQVTGLLLEIDRLDSDIQDVAAAAVASLDYTNAVPGTTFTAVWNGTVYKIGATTISSRPTARADISFNWSGGTTPPAFALAGSDSHDKDV